MPVKIGSFAVGILTILLSTPHALGLHATSAPLEPDTGCYIGAYIELDSTVNGDVGVFQSTVGKQHASYFRYVGYGRPFPYQWVSDLHSNGMAAHIAWEPNHGLGTVRDNDYLHGWAQAARHSGAPIFLRYASEMNGAWQAYSGDPAEYIKKWRMVYRTIKSVAPNVAMVWCPFATPRTTIPEYYPGDEYVDWVGVNIYSVMHQDGDLSKPPTEDPVSLLSYVYNLYADRKPIAICEYASTHYCRAENRDTTDFAIAQMTRLYSALPDKFPRVKMINWFSVDAIEDDLADNNYCLTANERVLDTYRGLISSPYFLSAIVDDDGVGPAPIPAPEPTAVITTRPEPPVPIPETTLPLAATEHAPVGYDGVWVAVLGAPPQGLTGEVEISVDVPSGLRGATVEIYIDGDFRCITNAPPYIYPWNTDRSTPGEHTIEARVTDTSGVPVGQKQVSVIVAKESP